jgi:hypothetical protein
MSGFSSNESNLLRELEINSPRPMKAPVNGIYIHQLADDPMWISCVVSKQSFQYVCTVYGNSWDRMVKNGLNCNMMTRNRWFDINYIVDVLKISGKKLIEDLNISYTQFHDWQLTSQEMIKLQITLRYVYKKYGKNGFIQEYIRFGSVDLRMALDNKQLYGIDFDFLKNFGQPKELKQLGWTKYYHHEQQQQQQQQQKINQQCIINQKDDYKDIVLEYIDEYDFIV